MSEVILEQKPMKLLFVDDEPNVLKSLRRLFRGNEYIIHLADGGMQALAILEREEIDLIISDMRMPQMDGAEFLSKAAERWPDIVRILLTGFADIDSTITAVNKGKIYSYCNKPWDDEELKALVNKALEQKCMADERVQLFEIINQQNQQLKDFNRQLEEKVEQRTAQLKNSLKQIDNAHKTLKKQYTDTIKTFARIIELRPGIKSGHAKYIAEIAYKVASKLGLSEEDKKNVLYAGLLLQIGKIGLDDDLLTQPFYSMPAEMRHRYLSHALEGEALLKNMAQLKEAALLIRHQFEHFDGSGFPNGLIGDQIPAGSRILQVVRDYISFLEGTMTGHGMTVADVNSRLINKKGSFYDPGVIDTFIAVLTEMKAETIRPVVEISWTKLQPGMEVEEIRYDDRLFLKDCVLDKAKIYDIVALRDKVGDKLQIKVRLGEADVASEPAQTKESQ